MTHEAADEKSIFLRAIAITSAEDRVSYLDAACGEDPALRARIEGLLRAHERPLGLLDAPDAPGPTVDLGPPREGPGTVIGPYKLLELIGEGGMGVVYMAEQTQPVRRKVALKIIKPGMDTRQVIARFEAERQALALMDHSNIARVLDAGATDSGRPYFAMELVKGIPITEYCDRDRVAIADRLELFVQVCQAVQHAHQKGIIHRDLKPTNVLVTRIDDAAVPKVIDFGVAKAIGQQLTEKTLFTGFAQLIGTPLYMSPEQTEFSGADVDTRSDIYSLGVLLYELLTGTTPFDQTTFRTAGYDEIRRIIREEEPPRPSTRVSTLDATATSVSANRQTDPRRLRKSLRGELDWIVMKCLEKDRDRRYETANALAADLRRHLNHEPVEAGPPSAWYRLRKFARRNRAVLATGAMVAAALVAVAVVSVVYATEQANATRIITGLAADLRKERESLKRTLADSNRLLAIRDFDRGQAAFDKGEIGPGMLWMIESWRSSASAGDPVWQHAARANLAAWQPYHARLKAVLSHPAPVAAAAFSPDAKVILTGGDDGRARLWDAVTGRPVGPPLPHPAAVSTVAFSPAGKIILTGSGDGKARLWDAASGRPIGPPLEHQEFIMSMAFRPDGKAVLTASSDGTVRQWDAATGRPIGSPLPHGEAVRGVAFSPDGKAMLAAGHDGKAWLWDAITGRPIGPTLLHEEFIMSMAFRPDGKALATGGHDDKARLWDAASGRPIGPPLEHQGPVRAVTFRPDGKVLLTASTDNTARLWDAATGAPLGSPLVHQGPVVAATFSPDARTLLTASSDGTVRQWDADLGPPTGPVLEHAVEIRSVVFSTDSKMVLTGSLDATARLWDAVTGKPLGPPLWHPDPVVTVAFSPDDRTLLTGTGRTESTRGAAWLWDAATGRPVGPPLPHPAAVSTVAFSPDGKAFLTGTQDRAIRLWDAATGQPISPPLPQPGTVDAAAFRPDGKAFAVGYDIGAVQIWDVSTRAPLGPQIRHPGAVSGLAFSPDGQALLTGCEDGKARLWDLATRQLRFPPLVHRAWVLGVAFSPDGTIVLTGSRDRTARLWDAATGRPIGPSFPHSRGVTAVAFSPDGRMIVTGNHDAKARIFPLMAELPDPLERVATRVEVMTGLTLDRQQGSIQVLDNAAWLASHERLKQLGGPPETPEAPGPTAGP